MSELIYAKAFLQQGSSQTKLNVYDHLTALIRKIIVERPANAVDYLEEYSRKIKEEHFKQIDVLKEAYVPPLGLDDAIKYSKLFKPTSLEPKEAADNEDAPESTLPNIPQLFYYLEQAGVSLPKHEIFCLGLSIKSLAETLKEVEKIRYWGKIFGIEKNYHVVEVTFSPESFEEPENETEVVSEEDEGEQNLESDSNAQQDQPTVERVGIFTKAKIPKLPKAPEIKTIEIKPENPGSGLNAKVYYVCHEPGDEWVKLPDVKPAEIIAARQLKVFFTGNLDTNVATYPPFPGTEMNYLRAQIARISAGTLISPLEYYVFDEDEDYEDENERSQILENEEYEPVPLTDLIDPSMSFWVHHSQHILQQGRTAWWNPKQGQEDEEGSEEESEEEEEEEEEEPEVGPPLLTPLSEDTTVDSITPWGVTLSSKLAPENAVVVVQSNIWPGAITYCTGGTHQKFENCYIGWGHKYSDHSYSPPPMPPIQNEYVIGPEVMAATDPSAEEEREVEIAKERKKRRNEEEEGEEEGEGDEEGEGEEDDDEDDDEEDD